jgi:hypothetical protein
MKILKNYYATAYMTSYFLRIVVNALALGTLIFLMHQSIATLGTFDLQISRNHALNSDTSLFQTASYAFDEATIIIALSGLMAVVLIALLSFMGTFVVLQAEPFYIFRVRLFIYTLCHLLICLALTAYLIFCITVLIQTDSLRLNDSTSFIWAYPTYTILVVVYLVELYGFMTKNQSVLALDEQSSSSYSSGPVSHPADRDPVQPDIEQ